MGNLNMEARQIHYRHDDTMTVDNKLLNLEGRVSTLEDGEPAEVSKADIAPVFSAETAYSAGDYVYHEGHLYKFTADHAAGTWSDLDTESAVVTSDLAELQSDLTAKQDATDNSLQTTDKTIVGGINELMSGLINVESKIDDATTYPFADVITIEDAIPANVADCSVKVEPVQNLHGYSQPWVGGAGKNKCAQTVDGIKARNSGFTWVGKQGTAYGITVTILTDDAENVMGYNFNGTCDTGFNFSFDDVSYVATESITINGCPDGAPCPIEVWRSGGIIGRDSGSGVTVESGSTALAVRVESGTSMSNVVYRPMIRLATETDATFAPYTNLCPISGHTEASVEVTDGDETTKTYTIALGDTIYGGTVDFDSGVMTVDRAIVDLGELTWAYQSGNVQFYTASEIADAKTGNVTNGVICSCYEVDLRPYSQYSQPHARGMIDKRIYIIDANYTDSTLFKASLSGQTMVYPLATPTIVQLTPEQIQLLKGTNTLTASTGQISVTVNGVSDSIGSVQEQVNDHEERIEAAESAIGSLKVYAKWAQSITVPKSLCTFIMFGALTGATLMFTYNAQSNTLTGIDGATGITATVNADDTVTFATSGGYGTFAVYVV